VTRSDWEAATPKCPGRPANVGRRACARLLDWTTAPLAGEHAIDDLDGVWCCPQHGPMLTGREAAGRAGWAPMRFANEAA
jgi:hypothetical protein